MSKQAQFVKVTATPGKRDELVAAFREGVAAVEAEPGTEVYALHTAVDDDDVVWFYEVYTDGDARTAHSTGDALKALGPKLAGLIAARPEIIRVAPVTAKGIAFE